MLSPISAPLRPQVSGSRPYSPGLQGPRASVLLRVGPAARPWAGAHLTLPVPRALPWTCACPPCLFPSCPRGLCSNVTCQEDLLRPPPLPPGFISIYNLAGVFLLICAIFPLVFLLDQWFSSGGDVPPPQGTVGTVWRHF